MYSKLTKPQDFCAPMGKCRNATKGGADAQKGVSPNPPSSCMGEAGDTDDVVCDLRDEKASLEDALSQMGVSFKFPAALCDAAGHHLSNLYHLSIDKVTQHMKIGGTTASKLE